MRIRTDFPRRVTQIENTWITLADGCRLAARIWLPEDAEADPVPAILEYLPYRKDDGTARADSTRHPYFAGHGYASVRVDIRGTGDSDGILLDEYLEQEQDDALEVIEWIAEQPWCTGSVGMIGYSWGGFNGLQIAARRPPALKAVISGCSTDDRYLDDCHYMGGCVLGSDLLKWASWMRGYNALPPDRASWANAGARCGSTVWNARRTISSRGCLTSATTRSGSRAPSPRSTAPSRPRSSSRRGWADAYTNAISRMLEHLTCPRGGSSGRGRTCCRNAALRGRRSASCRSA